MIAQVTPAELDAWRKDAQRPAPLVVDVREAWECDRARLPETLHIPLRELPGRAGELPVDRELVFLCHHGGRSAQAAQWLARNGFPRVHNLAGGIEAWSCTVDPAVPRY